MIDVLKQASKQASKQAKARIQRTFDIPSNGETETLLRKERDLLKTEERVGWSLADLCRAAWTEYVTRHWPGNPGLSLNHWTRGEPFSEAAREKLRKQATVAEKNNKLSDEDFARLFPEHARRMREEAQKRK